MHAPSAKSYILKYILNSIENPNQEMVSCQPLISLLQNKNINPFSGSNSESSLIY